MNAKFDRATLALKNQGSRFSIFKRKEKEEIEGFNASSFSGVSS